MKNRIIIAITAVLMALAFILPAQAAGNIKHAGGSGSGHAHGPHVNPQGKTVGNGDPYFNQSWWYQYNANQTQVQDWGGLTTSGDWPANTVQWAGTLTLVDTTTNNPSWQQSQTTYDNTGPDLTSPWEALNAGDTYKLEWHMVGTLLQPGWTWGTMSTGACVGTGTSTVTCDYTVNQILIAGFVTATPQATNTPAPTATPIGPTPTPAAANPFCNLFAQGYSGNITEQLTLKAYSDLIPGPNIGSIFLAITSVSALDGSTGPTYSVATNGGGNTSVTFNVTFGPLPSGMWVLTYDAGVGTNQGFIACSTQSVAGWFS